MPLPILEIAEVVGIVASLAPKINIGRKAKMTEVLIEPVEGCEDVSLPTQAHPGEDVGFDLYYSGPTTWVWPLQTKLLPVNCKIAMPPYMEATCRPRSGTSRRGILVHEGTVDPGYRGQIRNIVTNLTWLPKQVKHGERISQIVFQKVEPVELVKVEKLPMNSLRGEGGFGSTGKHKLKNNGR